MHYAHGKGSQLLQGPPVSAPDTPSSDGLSKSHSASGFLRYLATNDLLSSVVLNVFAVSQAYILCKFPEGMISSYTSLQSYSLLQKQVLQSTYISYTIFKIYISVSD